MKLPIVKAPRSIPEVETEITEVETAIAQRTQEMADRRPELQLWMRRKKRELRQESETGDASAGSEPSPLQALQEQQDAAWEHLRRLRLERVLAYAVKKGIKPKPRPTVEPEPEELEQEAS